jgi:DNA mismatch repair protein MutS
MSDAQFNTPMMKQYMQIKARYGDAILFFRLGDFYEMFLEDAYVGAKVLGITLTARHKGSDGKVPMAGVPYHAAENYINRLVKAGYKVAICEQVGEVQKGVEIVEREVVRVVTPSTNLAESGEDEVHRFLMTFSIVGSSLGVAMMGLTTGEVWVAEEQLPEDASNPSSVVQSLNDIITRYQPIEILLNEDWFNQTGVLSNFHRLGVNPFVYPDTNTNLSDAIKLVENHYGVDSLEGFNLHNLKAGIFALAKGLDYLSSTQKTPMHFLKFPRLIVNDRYLHLNATTIRNLELFSNIRSGSTEFSLFKILNKTLTPMGARLLRIWLVRPLLETRAIKQRQDVIDWFIHKPEKLGEINGLLKGLGDIDRYLSRVAVGVGNGRDINGLRLALERTRAVHMVLTDLKEDLLAKQLDEIAWAELDTLVDLISRAIADDPPITLTGGGVIRPGYSSRLDELREIAGGGRELLKQLEINERQGTGINSLKIGYNKVFGYYIEVSKANLDKVPDHYIRRQTLVNAERFIVPDLKEHEEKVLKAEFEANQLEYELYQSVVITVLQQTKLIHQISQFIGVLDGLVSLTNVARDNHYVRPVFTEGYDLEIVEGRHPVVEQVVEEKFIPNSLRLDMDPENDRGKFPRFIVLTGANMAGKSTYIRQVALLIIMAQIGSFVPAERMTLGVIDRVHSRIGAMDDLSSGLSTFMVEMTETASILNNLTDRSLVILDEVGRGTSTYDGVAIAWATSEFLIKESKAKVLFATHYLELTSLQNLFPGTANMHMAVAVRGKEIDFLYRVAEGKADQSYGIQVAKRAGLPPKVIERAESILNQLDVKDRASMSIGQRQLNLF